MPVKVLSRHKIFETFLMGILLPQESIPFSVRAQRYLTFTQGDSMRRQFVGFAVAALLLGSVPAMAANYGMAGCGLGALAFKDKPGKVQIAAATTNNLVSPQTFAITSGTSNCMEGSSGQQAALFININQEALRNDISRGNGEALTGLSQILKCSNQSKLGSTLQRNYRSIFPSSDVSPEHIGSSIENVIKGDAELSKSCDASMS
jgi:hypothetical protein